jgi:SAM-dependent methyltransferase
VRDPDATVHLGAQFVTRQFFDGCLDQPFLRNALAADWTREKWMVDFEWLDERTIRAPRLPFVTDPTQWCDAQFWDAAELTLKLEACAIHEGFELKDASAWNMLFDGTMPVLCDHGSVRPMRTRTWWAAGQFTRHFLLPLLLAQRGGLHANHALTLWRDGVPPTAASKIIGPSRYLSRFWPLMTAPQPLDPSLLRILNMPATKADLTKLQSHRTGLVKGFEFLLRGLEKSARRSGSMWSSYTQERDHYAAAASEQKLRCVARWLEASKPTWTLDLGCNTGEFTELAAKAGSQVVALDADHDSVQSLYLRVLGLRTIYPVVVDIDDLPGGRGWAGAEHAGLAQRLVGAFDMVFMLALFHHLAVAAAVPLHAIAKFAATVTRRWLVLELVDSGDVQMQRLCAERHRAAADFSAQAQRQAFEAAGFTVREVQPLERMQRSLLLLERNAG